MRKCGEFGKRADEYPNVIEISNFDANAYYRQMRYVKEDDLEDVEYYFTGLKDIFTQIGKCIYPSHFDFLTLLLGETENDEAKKSYVYVTRMDGDKGAIPEKLAETAGIKPIDIITFYEARTAERIPVGGYFFKKIDDNDILVKFAVVITNDEEKWLTSPEDLKKLYEKASKALKTIYSDPLLTAELRGNCGYSRDGYL
jgi:bifunctional DNA-binding transcriptional regulator/antitoxin component of YhaV-PrlF toxin-antitoxin module